MSQWSRDTYRAGDPYDSDTDTNPEYNSPARTPSPDSENEQHKSNRDEYSPPARSPSPESGDEKSGSDEDDSDTREPGTLWDDRRPPDIGTTTYARRLRAMGSENWNEDEREFMESRTGQWRHDAADQSDSEEESS